MSSAAAEFRQHADETANDAEQRRLIYSALGKYEVARADKVRRFQSWEEARSEASRIKFDAVNHLDRYLEEFARNAEARGTKVFFAGNGIEARDYVLKLAKERGVHKIVKSKAMTSEEIHLNEALEEAGYQTVESDLGEYIVQLRKEHPYHFVFPAMHLTRGQISDLFQKELGSKPTDSPEELTMIARGVMRRVYCEADMGISGANFLVADTGMISITENEGNARLTTSLPRVHVALVGIEKVVPKMEDLALLLPMLATAGAGQALTGYNSLIGGPRQPGEIDGPEEFHVVLIDNHRTRLLADAEQRDALHCIRCGACLNVCPIFKNIGGHSYGTTYQGPIGSVITPHFKGLQDWKHLSGASSLCGACTQTCPVKIDIHHHLLHNRRNAVQAKGIWYERIAFRGYAAMMNSPMLFRAGLKLGAFGSRFRFLLKGGLFDVMKSWTKSRDLPEVVSTTFDDWWRKRKK